MKIRELIEATGAKILSNLDKELEVKISTDTRTITKEDFYLPLKGASFDGEKFISQAIEKGAVGAFCTNPENDGQLLVNDTLEAYLKLANYRRKKLDFTVVAITGSSGKTTTKELVASTLEAKFKVFKTPLNHNNEIGFCQTVFEAPDDTEILVLEMGMRGLGEIELLSKYAEPDITIISNVGTAHIGRLGSRENIAKAKCEIVKYQRGNVFIAHNDDLIKNTVQFNGEKIFYSINDVKVLEKGTLFSKFEYKNNIFELNVGGDYNIENALSAINCGLKLNMSIEEIQSGLKKYHPIEKRWEATQAGKFQIINDSYNANPESMRAFIDTIFELYPDYTIILGDMGELGDNEQKYHQELGAYVNSHKKLNKNMTILSVGTLSKNITNAITNCEVKHFDNIEACVEYIKMRITQNYPIFLKASRSMRFEKIIEQLNNK
jgi:UDP-N-acetylmuramoyl-tripeptide--D-alanyl-D-alanine ligase